MGADHPIAMVLLILICLFGIAITTKGPNLRNLELKLTGDISVQCNNDIDCPIELICEKSACRKPGLVSIHMSKDIPKLTRNQNCKDKWKAKKCKKRKKKGHCKKKKVAKKCKKTCEKCPTIPCPGTTIPNGDGNCVCPGNTIDYGNGNCSCPGDTVIDGVGHCSCPGDTVDDGLGACSCPENMMNDGDGNCFPTNGTKVMITTGIPDSSATKTEVVDVVNGDTCADLADFPLENMGAVGANLHGTPVVCGGIFSGFPVQTCYKFTNAGWQEFASMKEKRWNFAGVMHKNKFHVFGGYGRGAIWGLSKTTELISLDGGVEDGPELPEAVRYHAITSINSTVSILSGGTSATPYSRLTWYFNHETNVFTSGPNLLFGRHSHGSATVVDKVTNAKIPMVTGGRGNGGRLSSTELLINGMWQPGPQLPKHHSGISIVEIQGDAFSFGGWNSGIYRLTCSSGKCSWSTLNQALKVERVVSVAIPVPDYFCEGTTTTTTVTTTTTMPTCADIWLASKCKEKKEAGECDTSCTTDDCVKTQKKCKKKCNIC